MRTKLLEPFRNTLPTPTSAPGVVCIPVKTLPTQKNLERWVSPTEFGFCLSKSNMSPSEEVKVIPNPRFSILLVVVSPIDNLVSEERWEGVKALYFVKGAKNGVILVTEGVEYIPLSTPGP